MTAIACRVCGLATTANVEVRRGQSPMGSWDPSRDITVGVCPVCTTLDSATIGLAVRACLRLIKKPESDWSAFGAILTDMEIDPAAVLFEVSGGGRGPQRRRFAHVPREVKNQLRRAYARVLADRVAATLPQPEPEPEGPPSGSACLCCGKSKDLVWGGPLLSHGFTHDSRSVEGWLCEICSDVYSNVGAVGSSFFEQAFQRHTGIAWSPRNVRPWIATGLEPPTEPFGWMDVQEEPLTLDPVSFLMDAVATLQGEVLALQGEIASLRSVPVP